jgi:hypothetical protein
MKTSLKCISYYPVFTDEEILKDHIVRAAWYLSCSNPDEVVFVVQEGVIPDFSIPNYFDERVAMVLILI